MEEKQTLIKTVGKRCKTAYHKAENVTRILLGRDLSGEEERLKSKKWRSTTMPRILQDIYLHPYV